MCAASRAASRRHMPTSHAVFCAASYLPTLEISIHGYIESKPSKTAIVRLKHIITSSSALPHLGKPRSYLSKAGAAQPKFSSSLLAFDALRKESVGYQKSHKKRSAARVPQGTMFWEVRKPFIMLHGMNDMFSGFFKHTEKTPRTCCFRLSRARFRSFVLLATKKY